MASIRTLPVEVFDWLVTLMEESGHDQSLAALARTCSAFHQIVMPHLYSPAVVLRNPGLLYWAAHFGRTDTARRVLATGVARVDNPKGTRFSSPLHIFQEKFRTKTPRETYGLFFRKGRQRDGFETGNNRWFPLHHAVMNGYLDIVKLLVEAGASVAAPVVSSCPCYASLGDVNWMPLHAAICYGQTHVAKWLLENGAPIRTRYETPAFHNAARHGSLELLSFMLDNGYQTDIHEPDEMSSLSPVWFAYRNDQWEALDLLLARGADIDDDIGNGYTMLIDACVAKSYRRAIYLVDRGASVNVTCHAFPAREDPSRPSPVRRHLHLRPLDICCRRHALCRQDKHRWRRDLSGTEHEHLKHKGDSDRRRLVSKLIAAGAHMNACEAWPDRIPPLVAAAAEHMPDVVEALIRGGAPIDLPDQSGVTPLAAAFAHHSGSCLNHLKLPDSDASGTSYQAQEECTRWLPKHGDRLSEYWESENDNSESAEVPGSPGLSESSQGLEEKEEGPGGGCTFTGISDDVPVNGLGVKEPGVHDRLKRVFRHSGCAKLRKCVELLVSSGANVNLADHNGNTPFIRLCVAAPFRRYLMKDQEPNLRDILPWEANLMKDQGPDEVLWDMYHKDKSDMAPLLLGHGGDPSARLMPTTKYGEGNARELMESGWPATALQHAWWDGNIKLCKVLTTGREIGKDTMIWMFELLWKKLISSSYCRHPPIKSALLEQAYQFLRALPVSAEDCPAKAAVSLAVALRLDHVQDAQTISEAGLTLEGLQALVSGLGWFYGEQHVGLGTICLDEAVRIGRSALAITEKLLGLGVKPSLSATTLLAVDKRDVETIVVLAKHGAEFNVKDDVAGEANVIDSIEFGEHGCKNPLRYAIKWQDVASIRAILTNFAGDIDPWFRCYYLKDACNRLRPAVIACLLEYPKMRVEQSDLDSLPDDMAVDVPLVYLTEQVGSICGLHYRAFTCRPAIKSRLKYIDCWIGCLSAFSNAGVDPRLRNKAGKSGIDFLGDLLVYMGKDRFKIRLRNELRARSNLPEAVEKVDRDCKEKLALECYEALGLPEIYDAIQASLQIYPETTAFAGFRYLPFSEARRTQLRG